MIPRSGRRWSSTVASRPDTLVPLAYLATQDVKPLLDLIAQWSGKAIPIIKGTQFNGVRVGTSALLLFAPVGDTVMTIAENIGGESIDQVSTRIGLSQVLEDSWRQGPKLVDSKRYTRAMGDAVGSRQAMMYFDVANLQAAFKQPMLEASAIRSLNGSRGSEVNWATRAL